MGPINLALREMRRRAGRFLILVGAVTVLVFFLLFQQALLGGLISEFVGALRNNDADGFVYGELARDNLQASVVSPDTVAAVGAVDGVRQAGSVGVGTFTASVAAPAPDDRRDVTLFGYELGGPGGPDNVTDGRLPQAPGEALASDAGTGFAVGDTVELADGGTISIVGVGDELSFSVTPTLFVSFDTYAQARTAQNPDASVVPPSAVAVWVDQGADPTTVMAAVDAAVPGVDALTRTQAADEAPGVASVQQSFSVILLLGWLTVGTVIGFFFLILTTQKLPQLTLLRAMGVHTAELAGAVATQIVIVVAAGFALGALGTTQALSGGSSGLNASLSSGDLGSAAAILGVLAAIALAVSAWRIRGLDPVDAVDQGADL